MKESEPANGRECTARARLGYAAVAAGAPLVGFMGIFGLSMAVAHRAPLLILANLAGPWSGWLLGEPEAALAYSRPGLSWGMLGMGVIVMFGATWSSERRVRAVCLAGCLTWSTAWCFVGSGPMFSLR